MWLHVGHVKTVRYIQVMRARAAREVKSKLLFRECSMLSSLKHIFLMEAQHICAASVRTKTQRARKEKYKIKECINYKFVLNL